MHSTHRYNPLPTAGLALLLATLLILQPFEATAQQRSCANIPDSVGEVPDWVLQCRDTQAAKAPAVALDPASIGFGWESVSDDLNSLVLGTPEIFTNLGGTAFGNFVGACDFAGSDSSILYCLDSPGNLFTVATDGSGTSTFVGAATPFGSETFTSLDWDPTTSTMYATSTNLAASSLYTINLGTAAATRIGATTSGLNCSIAGGFNNAGTLFVYDLCNDSMFSVNKGTAAATLLGPIGFNANFGQGMDFDASDDTCYLFAFNGGAFQPELRTCNTSTGSTTFVGVLGSIVPGGLVQLGGGGVAPSGPVDADLSVEKTIEANEDGSGSFHITVTNHGPADATNVVVQDNLPPALTILNVDASQGTFMSLGGTWDVGDLAVDSSATLWLDVRFDATGIYCNEVWAEADENDPDASNNHDEVCVLIRGDRPAPDFVSGQGPGRVIDRGGTRFLADLALTKKVDDATPGVGDNVTYTLTVLNNGPNTTGGVEVTDHLPECLALVSTDPAGVYDGWVWNVGQLKVNKTKTLKITATVTADCQGEVINVAEITGSNLPDPDDLFRGFDTVPPPPDDIAEASFTVSAAAAKASAETKLLPGYPNPFNPETVIPFELSEATQVTVRVYDLLGRLVQTLVDGDLSAGVHEVSFRAERLPTGVYLVRMEAAGKVFTQRITLMK